MTATYFQNRREENTTTSRVREAGRKLGGIIQYPTNNTYDPKLALSSRCRQRQKLFSTPKYALINKGVRDEEIVNFAEVSMLSFNNFSLVLVQFGGPTLPLVLCSRHSKL